MTECGQFDEMNDMQKNGFKLVLAMLIGLAVGIALGRGVGHRGSLRAAETQPVAPRVAPPPRIDHRVQGEQDSAMAELRRQVADLERILGDRTKTVETLRQSVLLQEERASKVETLAVAADDTRAVPPISPREDPATRMERMQRENPERYAEVQQRREDRLRRMDELHDNRRTFLESVDVSRMTEEQRENHQRLLDAMSKAAEFQRKITVGDWSQLSEEERMEGFNTVRNLDELYREERRYIIEETGRSYGEDGARFADYIENVLDNTSVMPRFGRERGDRRGSHGGRYGHGDTRTPEGN